MRALLVGLLITVQSHRSPRFNTMIPRYSYSLVQFSCSVVSDSVAP